MIQKYTDQNEPIHSQRKKKKGERETQNRFLFSIFNFHNFQKKGHKNVVNIINKYPTTTKGEFMILQEVIIRFTPHAPPCT